MKKTYLKLPYGTSSWMQLRQSNCAYVDKTRFIEILENENSFFPFLVRPRRFGKTLFTDMLFHYYDAFGNGNFDTLFKGTYIHEHPTPNQGCYRVLRFNFSGLDSGHALVDNFIGEIRNGIADFFRRYPLKDGKPEFLNDDYTSPAKLLNDFASHALSQTGKQDVYVVIDEYDQFANDILSNNQNLFREITAKEGFLKNFYATIKKHTQDLIYRTFITGVSSITLDSITSGFNIAANISFEKSYLDMFGFSQSELKELIYNTVDLEKYGKTADEIVKRMKIYYDGYRFNRSSDTAVFNPTICLYYLKHLANYAKEPDTMTDPAVFSDLIKIDGLMSLAQNPSLVKEVVFDIINDRPVHMVTLPATLNLNTLDKLRRHELLSLLFYLGFLTWSSGDELTLCCPNKAVREQFFDYYFTHILNADPFVFILNETLKHSFALLKQGRMYPLLKTVSEKLDLNSGLHASTHLNENSIQCAVQMAILLSNDFTATAEQEVLGQGHCDLIIEEKDQNNPSKIFIVEFKYLKKAVCSEKKIDEQLEKAKQQLLSYAQSPSFANIQQPILCAAVFSGTKLAKYAQKSANDAAFLNENC